MKINHNTIRLIDTYLFNKLNSEDKASFETQASNDQNLQQALEVSRMEHLAMEMVYQQDLKNRFQQWNDEDVEKNHSSTRGKVSRIITSRMFIKLLAAAAIFIIIGFFGLRWVSFGVNMEEIAIDSFQATFSLDRGFNNLQIPNNLQTGLLALQEQDYKSAIIFFRKEKDVEYIEIAEMLLGESQFLDGDYEAAESTFREVLDNSSNPLNLEKAEWYLILSRMASKKPQVDYEGLMKKITSDQNHSFYPHAEQLRKTLNSLW